VFLQACLICILNNSVSIIKSSVGIISNATLIENHPWVDDATQEEALIGKEAKAQVTDLEEELRKTNPNGGAEDEPTE